MAEFDSVIPAGQSGKLTAKIQTKPSQHGRLSKGIGVITDAPGAESLSLTVVLDVVAPIIVKPRFRLDINTSVGQTRSSKIFLSRSDGNPLEVSPVKPDEYEDIKITVQPAKDQEGAQTNAGSSAGEIWVEATVVNPQTVATRILNVVLKTNHPDAKELTIPLTVRVR